MPLTQEQVANKIATARAHKALFIADALTQVGCDSETARNLDADGRRKAEKAARVRAGSDDTWKVVFSILERRERTSREEADEHVRQLLRA